MTNMEEAGKDCPRYERSRNSQNKASLVMCAECKIFITQGSMFNHKKTCSGKEKSIDVRLIAEPTEETSESFKKNVIATMRNDTVGMICKKDRNILICGYWSFQKVKRSQNVVGARDSVRKDMRYLGHCYMHFLNSEPSKLIYNNSKDMFLIENFKSLSDAIDKYCGEGKNLKAGLKHGLQYSLISAAKTLKAIAYTQQKDNEAIQIEKFQSVFKLWEDTIFGDSELKLQSTADKKAKKPAELPVEKDLSTLRDHLASVIQKGSSGDITSECYIPLRNAICARLTLYNARRGGEPARISEEDLREGLNDSWLPVDDLEKSLMSASKITYITGKRHKLVPLIIPRDVIKGLEILIDPIRRANVSISKDNNYVFASTKHSDRHTSGWHALNFFCKKLNLTTASKITATKNRHRMSTSYAMMDMNESDKAIFYDHMGHSKGMNEQRYQCPPAKKELETVGTFCDYVDKSKKILII